MTSAWHSPASNPEYTFRGLFEALSVSAVSNQALLDRTVRIEAALRVVLAKLLPNGPHTMPAAFRRVNEEVESLGDTLKQAREEREAEMALREKVEQERDQANAERDQLEERVRGLRTELRTCKRRAVNLSTYLEQALAEKERISDDLGFTQQRLSIQLAATMSEKRRVWNLASLLNQKRADTEIDNRRQAQETATEALAGTNQAASSALARVGTQERCMAPVAPVAAPAARVQAAQPPEVVALLGKIRGLRTRLREAQDEAKKYKDLATRVENAIQAQLSSMVDQVRELDRQQRSHEEEVAEVEERYRVEVAGHREASRALATATQRFPDVVPAFWDWVSAHFRVTSGPVFDRLLEAWVWDDPALFEDNCENLSIFAFPTRQPPSTRARGRILGVSYDNWSAVLARDQRSHSLAVPTLPTPTSPFSTTSYQGSPGPTRTMTLVTFRGRGFEPQLNVGGFGGSLRGGPDHKGLWYGLPWPRKHLEQCPNKSSSPQMSTPSSKRPSTGASAQLTKKVRRSDPDAAGPLGASLPPAVDSAYAAVVARSPWERYSTTQVSFVPLSWHQLPEWRELDQALRSFWQKYAHSIWNRSFMTSSGAAEREIEALMGPLLGIAGSLFRVVQAYGVQLLRFLCYPHSYWPEFLREGVSLRNLITLHGGQAVADYVQTQGPEWWPVVPFLGRSKPFAPPFMSVLSWLHGRTLRAKRLNRFSPGNPAVCTRAAISSAIGWMIQEAISARDAGNVGGVYPFIVGSHSHPPVGSQWARGLRPPQGPTPGSPDPPLPVRQAPLGIPTSPAPASAANPVVLDDSSEGSRTDAD
ncbi:hypothetical protein DYB38_011195 [Aphanomyces astaci]|uniref:Uncharacterized protein n=1 Tax=Aphanomyces astaci TaxID=112090 RepID=A0A397DXH8_APHAT|nr:hypothetical protein DYB38_011195 [Aphanomyces astaci]